jgi:ribosomal protein L40E
MNDQFREIEDKFNRLKLEFNEELISQREFADSLKDLRVKDGEGRFWMIGAQSGKWYFYDGNEWIQAQPPSIQERKAICIYCGFENDLEAEVCARCGSFNTPDEGAATCPRCGRELETASGTCPECGISPGSRSPDAPGPEVAASPSVPEGGLVIKSVSPGSCLWVFGVLGLFGGMILGLAAGVTGVFPGFVAALPGFFRDIQGTLHGGIVFTVFGGVLGFALGAGGGYLWAGAVNAVLSLTGGLRIGTERTAKRE